jgi:hypothetical protein
MMTRIKKILVLLFLMLKIIGRKISSGNAGYQFLERTIIRRMMDKNLPGSGQKSDMPLNG